MPKLIRRCSDTSKSNTLPWKNSRSLAPRAGQFAGRQGCRPLVGQRSDVVARPRGQETIARQEFCLARFAGADRSLYGPGPGIGGGDQARRFSRCGLHCDGRFEPCGGSVIAYAGGKTIPANVSSRQRGPQRGSNRRSTAGFWSDTFCDREQIREADRDSRAAALFLEQVESAKNQRAGAMLHCGDRRRFLPFGASEKLRISENLL